MHFWYHDLVDLMAWSPQFRNQNDAKATAAGSEWMEPQPLGIEITRCTKLRDPFNFWSQTHWNLFGNPYLWIASSPRFLKCTHCFYAIGLSIMLELVWKLAMHDLENLIHCKRWWNLFTLNCKIPIDHFDCPFRRSTDVNYVGTRLKTLTRPQQSMQGTQWSTSKIVYMAGSIAREAYNSPLH